MNRYTPRHPRMLGIAAALMSALVLTLAVGVPTQLAGAERERALAHARPAIEVAIEPAMIDVVGVRAQRTAESAPAAGSPSPRS